MVQETAAIAKVDAEVFQAAYAFAAIPARYALERRRWSEAAALQVVPLTFPWDRFRYAEAITYFARAIGIGPERRSPGRPHRNRKTRFRPESAGARRRKLRLERASRNAAAGRFCLGGARGRKQRGGSPVDALGC